MLCFCNNYINNTKNLLTIHESVWRLVIMNSSNLTRVLPINRFEHYRDGNRSDSRRETQKAPSQVVAECRRPILCISNKNYYHKSQYNYFYTVLYTQDTCNILKRWSWWRLKYNATEPNFVSVYVSGADAGL